MRYLVLAGRVLFALIFILAAPRHFTHEGIQHAADLGTPLAGLLVPLSGAMIVLGGLSVATGYKARWGAWILVAFLVPVTLMMHSFWRVGDPDLHRVQVSMFGKNLSMLGAALLLTYFGAGPLSVDERQSR
ncbi:MAG TPA: DoxX family protein [Edaphobacter sp.]|jgi:putative oxidoreductase|nr:DoxX family protein [Edaphobacter sp.]